MIDISEKKVQARTAVAEGTIRLKKETVDAIRASTVKKGDVLEIARTAAIMASKSTPQIIPYCHIIPLEKTSVDFDVADSSVKVRCEVGSSYKTGVEMEALTCASVALLTVWDMVKYIEKDETGNYPLTSIENVHVVSKVKKDA
ncbi:molybdenum cofactor biosynthesis protein MoaC [uncultured archaeon]|nr:molybdenum cofactor biosynthesis protein MoaC [uncultured archaeon]HKJ96572.1 cyclic pyranopterin monophosphate synthase MoaC [Thermoplasmataceae archaeon]